jgi:hypothetical protein
MDQTDSNHEAGRIEGKKRVDNLEREEDAQNHARHGNRHASRFLAALADVGDAKHVSGDYSVKRNLQKKRDIPADLSNELMRFIVREHEAVVAIEHEADHTDCEQHPHQTNQSLAAAAALVEIRDHVPGPGQHGQKHEHEIEDGQIVDVWKKSRHFLVLVQKSPCHIHYQVAACGNHEPIVANMHLVPLFLASVFKTVIREQFPVQYQIEYQHRCRGYRI